MSSVTFIADLNCFSLQNIGGTDSYMRRLTEVLLENDFNINFVYCNTKFKRNYRYKNINIYELPNIKSVTKFIKNMDNIFICYLNLSDRMKFFFYKKFFCYKKKIFLILFFFPDSCLKKIFRVIEFVSIRYTAIVCVSKRINQFAQKYYGKSYFLPPIIPDSYIKKGLSKLKESSNKKLNNALFLGRIDKRKGILEVLKIAKFTKDFINWTISGIKIDSDKPQSILKELKEIDYIKFIMNNREEYKSTIEDDVIEYFYKNDFFLQPYKNLKSTVDLPLLILEAQACGCIVITSLPELLNDYLIYPSIAFKNFDPSEVKDYILNFQKNSDVNQSIKLAISNIKSNYSNKIILKKFIKILND